MDISQINAWFNFDETNVKEEMRKQSSRSFYVGKLMAKAKKQLAISRAKHEATVANLYKKYKDRYTSIGEKITEDHIKSLLNSNPKVIEGKKIIAEGEYTLDLLNTAYKSLHVKSEMLINVAHTLRKEIDASLH